MTNCLFDAICIIECATITTTGYTVYHLMKNGLGNGLTTPYTITCITVCVVLHATRPLMCRVDEMTGGVMREGPSPLDTMTEEEKEQEAIKLNELIHRLNRYIL